MAVQIAPFEPVCFWPSGQHECYRIDEAQPVTATIAWCNVDGTVNIGGLDHRGAAFAATDVKVLPYPPIGGGIAGGWQAERCCWHAFGQRREVPVGTTTLTFSDEQPAEPNDLQAGGLYKPDMAGHLEAGRVPSYYGGDKPKAAKVLPAADIPEVPDELKDVFDHAKP